MKKLISLILVLILVTSLCACEKLDHSANIRGTWKMDYLEDDELRDDLLTAIELYDEEIALVTARLHGIKVVTFNADKTYTFSEPVEDNKACVREFYDNVFSYLYGGRSELKGLYEQDISAMGHDDFMQFYAELYGTENYEALLDKLSENAFDWSKFGVTEKGTYTVSSESIKVDSEDDEFDGSISYTVEGDTLTLTYADGTERYTKVN